MDLSSGEVERATAATAARLDRRPGRHRPGHADRRPHQAPEPYSATRRSCSPGATASRTSTSTSCSSFTGARQARDGHRRAPAGALRRTGFEGDRVVEFTEKPQTGEGWINGGFFVLEPAVLRLHRRRRHAVGEGAAGEAGARRPADGVSARALLAVHGHAARQARCSERSGKPATRPGRPGS